MEFYQKLTLNFPIRERAESTEEGCKSQSQQFGRILILYALERDERAREQRAFSVKNQNRVCCVWEIFSGFFSDFPESVALLGMKKEVPAAYE